MDIAFIIAWLKPLQHTNFTICISYHGDGVSAYKTPREARGGERTKRLREGDAPRG